MTGSNSKAMHADHAIGRLSIGDFHRACWMMTAVRLSGVSSIDNLKYLLANIQNRLPIIDDTVREILDSVPSLV